MSEWLDKLSATYKSIKDQKAAFCMSRRLSYAEETVQLNLVN